jgi:hypothetical protein
VDRSFDPVEHVRVGRTVGTHEQVAEVSVLGVGGRGRRGPVDSVRERRRHADHRVVALDSSAGLDQHDDGTGDDRRTHDGAADVGARAGVRLHRG